METFDVKTQLNPLFDEQHYLSANPDVEQAVNQGLFSSGLDHYQQYGATELRQPVPGFINAYFLSELPENLAVSDASEMILALGGNDDILALNGNDFLNGNQGDDFLNGNQGDDTVHGGQGHDTIHGGKDNDILFGDLGNDQIFGDLGNDGIYGGLGYDILFGNIGDDTIYGNQDDDTLYGSEGDDILYGGKNNDLIFGGSGSDRLSGDRGSDTLYGGGDSDRFALGKGTGSFVVSEADWIQDFTLGVDLIELTDGLIYDDLNIFAGSEDYQNHTIIQNQVTGEYLAILQGIERQNISADDFLYAENPLDKPLPLAVTNPNQNPILVNPIGNQIATEGTNFNFIIPADTFRDPDGNSLSYTAAQTDGSPLPGWLNFDPNTGTFSGQPTSSDVGNLRIEVTGIDGNGGTVSHTFELAIEPAIANNLNSDRAGNTPATARNLGIYTGTQTFQDFVGTADTDDYYFFSLATPSNLRLQLDPLTANADIQLLDSSGNNVLLASANPGTIADIITAQLAAGDYYILVNGNTDTNYKLTVSGQNITGPAYYVSADGNDANPGTFDLPFRTIQKAAQLASPGETVYIRSGTYRENVVPKNSGELNNPITFTSFANENVTISGTEVITGWTQHNGNIYKASMLTDLGEGKNQVFVNGEMMTAARWPNIPGNPASLTRADNAIADNGGVVSGAAGGTATGIYTDSDLAAANFPNNFWQGAKINFLPGWNWSTQTGEVVSNQGGEVQFNFNWKTATAFNNEPYKPQAENAYYLWGKYEALDTAKEWYYDAPTNSLYLWSPNGDDPSNYTVEVKQRDYAFQVFNRSDIHLKNINIFGAAIQVVNSERIILDGIKSQYGTHTQVLHNPFEFSPPAVAFADTTNSQLKNSSVAYAAASGVSINRGSGNRVTNTVIHDVGYMGTHGSAVEVNSSQPEITNNTLFNSGSRLINLLESAQGNISHNEVYNGGLQASDFGGIIAFENSGQNTTISHNSIHDMNALYNRPLNYFGSAGIIIEKSDNFLVSHNVIYNTTIEGFKYFDASGVAPVNLQLVNNTIDGEIMLRPRGSNRMLGTEVKNNIYRGIEPFSNTSDVTFENNLSTNNFEGLFEDLLNRDYRPLPGSDAVGKGALAVGQQASLPGATILETDLPALQIEFNQPVNGTLSGRITGLPIGRKLPMGFQLIIGAAEPSGNFQSSYFDPMSNLSTVTFTNVAIADQTGQQPVYMQIGDNQPIELGQMVNLG